MKRTIALFILLIFFATGIVLITSNDTCHQQTSEGNNQKPSQSLNLISGEMLIEKGSEVLYRKTFAFDNQEVNKPAFSNQCSGKKFCNASKEETNKCRESQKLDSSFAFREEFGQEEFSTFIGRKDLIVVEDTTVLCYDPTRIEQFVPVETNHSASKTSDKKSVLPVFNTYRILKKKLPDGTTMKVIFLQTVINSLGANVKG
jgi:hypothetical protein